MAGARVELGKVVGGSVVEVAVVEVDAEVEEGKVDVGTEEDTALVVDPGIVSGRLEETLVTADETEVWLVDPGTLLDRGVVTGTELDTVLDEATGCDDVAAALVDVGAASALVRVAGTEAAGVVETGDVVAVYRKSLR